ncbi:MAG: hypothetical protein K0Q76_2197 [Panacagrimonas sp.]|jgi:hypothetical protein|nr:hypothetical protein [Panacagrimonas sp.]MCC2657089.1 hypothetical protein [Panacagrimonas sp.]
MTGSKLQQPLVDAEQLQTLYEGHQPLCVIDVRSAEEFAAGFERRRSGIPTFLSQAGVA